MKRPQFTPEEIEYISEEIIGDLEELLNEQQPYEYATENMIRTIRNKLRLEQERRLRDL